MSIKDDRLTRGGAAPPLFPHPPLPLTPPVAPGAFPPDAEGRRGSRESRRAEVVAFGGIEWGGGGWPKVLIVDDAEDVTRALSRVLDVRGYRSRPFGTLAGGADWLERHARIDPPAVVLVDIHLPDGNGLDLARRARELLGPGAVIIVLSGDTSIENLRALPDTGTSLFVAKPLHVPTLLTFLPAPRELPQA